MVLFPHQAAEQLGARVAHEGHSLLHRPRAVDDQPDVQREVLGDFESRDRLRAAILRHAEIILAEPLRKPAVLVDGRNVELHDVDSDALDCRLRPAQHSDVVGLAPVFGDGDRPQIVGAGIGGVGDRDLVGPRRPRADLLLVEKELHLLRDSPADRLHGHLHAHVARPEVRRREHAHRHARASLVDRVGVLVDDRARFVVSHRAEGLAPGDRAQIDLHRVGRAIARDQETFVQIELDFRNRRLDLGRQSQQPERRLAVRGQDLQLRLGAPRRGVGRAIGQHDRFGLRQRARVGGSHLRTEDGSDLGHEEIDLRLSDLVAAGVVEEELDVVSAGRHGTQE